MKWFKHYTGTLGSESMSNLIRDCGLEGYARYWILLEYLASLFDGESASFRVPIEIIRGLFRVRSWNGLDMVVERLTTVRGINIKRSGNVYEIEAPILLELLDRDFKKARKLRETVALTPRLDKDKDKEVEVEFTKKESATNKFHNSFNAEYQNISSFLKERKLFGLKRYVAQIFEHFETFETFCAWIDENISTAQKKGVEEKDVVKYLVVSAKKEIGVL